MTWKTASLLLGLLLATSASAVTQGQQDDFTASEDGWTPGTPALGGPGGGADGFLLLTSTGTGGQGGRLTTYNYQLQWSGDYLAAGVEAIGLFVNNFGANDLEIRLAFGDNQAPLQGGTWYVTSASVALPAGSGWELVVFEIGSADLVSAQGSASYAQLMAGVQTLRILHADAAVPIGNPIAASLGIDRVVALPEPGATVLLASGLAALALCARARRARV
jgi:hypothetical protein